MSTREQPTDFAGAMSLIQNCVGGSTGERLLIVSEPEDYGMYDVRASKLAAAAGRAIGMTVYELESSTFVNNDEDKAILLDSLRGFDHIVFFARVGDQIRFLSSDNMPPSTMCYTLDQESLNSNFGTACHHGMSEIKHLIDTALENSSEIHVTCPLGTDYVGRPDWGIDTPVEVALKRFPLLVPQPIPARGFKGRIALSRFLIGTGSQYYDPYYLPLPNKVFACVEDNRIVGFEAIDEDVLSVENHYKHVSEQFSIDPWYVDSWHAGIHPGCNFETDAETDMMRWSGSAFGNPRILHFHTCGQYAPGEICWNVLDPTIAIDGVVLWEAGTLHPERLPEGHSVLARHPQLAELFSESCQRDWVGLLSRAAGLGVPATRRLRKTHDCSSIAVINRRFTRQSDESYQSGRALATGSRRVHHALLELQTPSVARDGGTAGLLADVSRPVYLVRRFCGAPAVGGLSAGCRWPDSMDCRTRGVVSCSVHAQGPFLCQEMKSIVWYGALNNCRSSDVVAMLFSAWWSVGERCWGVLATRTRCGLRSPGSAEGSLTVGALPSSTTHEI